MEKIFYSLKPTGDWICDDKNNNAYIDIAFIVIDKENNVTFKQCYVNQSIVLNTGIEKNTGLTNGLLKQYGQSMYQTNRDLCDFLKPNKDFQLVGFNNYNIDNKFLKTWLGNQELLFFKKLDTYDTLGISIAKQEGYLRIRQHLVFGNYINSSLNKKNNAKRRLFECLNLYKIKNELTTNQNCLNNAYYIFILYCKLNAIDYKSFDMTNVINEIKRLEKEKIFETKSIMNR